MLSADILVHVLAVLLLLLGSSADLSCMDQGFCN